MAPRETGAGEVEEEEQQSTEKRRVRTTERMPSFASDSAASNASSTGVESFLESRKLDPERILFNLGFGSQDSGGDLGLSRIPQRFLQPSQVKGISISDFYKHEKNLAETFETGFYGYRGLTGPSHTPSPIVAKIMERLRHRDPRHLLAGDSQSIASAPASTPATPTDLPESPLAAASPQQKFAAAAQRVQQSRSILTRIQSWKSTSQEMSGSVLNPDNRAFLQSQSLNKSPEIPRRRIIMGHRSYTFSGDGDLIECKQDDIQKPESVSSLPETSVGLNPVEVTPIKRPHPPLVHKDSLLSSNTSFSEESEESEEEYRHRSYSGRLRQRLRGPSPKRECPDIKLVEEKVEELPEPQSQSPPLPPLRNFSKRLSSTSISSWESENWVPSPPISGKLIYSTFSSIDETCELPETTTSDIVEVKSDHSESPTSGLGSTSEPISEREPIRQNSSINNRRGSLRRQSRVSSVDEENWNEMSTSDDQPSTSTPRRASLDPSSLAHKSGADMAGIVEEPMECLGAVGGFSRSGSAQSDSSGFQEGEAAAAQASATMSPSQASRLEQLQTQMARVATGLESFRAEILTETDPDAQARIQTKVDQISGVLLHLQSLCEDLQKGNDPT